MPLWEEPRDRPVPGPGGSHRPTADPAEPLREAGSTSRKAELRKGRKHHKEEEGMKRSEKHQREQQGQRRSGRKCSRCQSRYPPPQSGKDPGWSRWTCPEGSAAHGQSLPEQMFLLKDCSQQGAHARAEQ